MSNSKMSAKKLYKILAVSIASTILMCTFQNCTKGFKTNPTSAASQANSAASEPTSSNSSTSSSTSPSSPPTPPSNPPTNTTSSQDFQTRCSAPGVLVCQGFDNASVFTYTPGQADGLMPIYGTNTIRAFQDTMIKYSGNSSLRFDIEDNTGPDDAGNFTVDFGHTFTQHSTFYVQFAVRFDSNYINNDWWGIAQTSPKIIILYEGTDTCDHIELTTNEWYGAPMPDMYTDCGARSLTTSTTNTTSYRDVTQPPFLFQQGASTTDGYNCAYSAAGNYPVGTGNGNGCFNFTANTWMTLYYKVSVGTWGSPNSSIQAWAIINGTKKEWINVQNMTLYADNTSDPQGGFDHLMFTPYMTNKSASAVYPTAHMWIDNLIVSSQAIADPQ